MVAQPSKQRGRREEDTTRINEKIESQEIRLIDEEGTAMGVVTREDGLARAEAAGLDLVEVSPTAKPPVCKIMNYGKHRYEAQKKAKAAKKNQKIINTKEIKLRPGIEQHDYEVKMKAARKFIETGDKVKVSLRFRGREMAHQNLGRDLLNKVSEELKDIAQIEHHPNMEGRQLIMILGPL